RRKYLSLPRLSMKINIKIINILLIFILLSSCAGPKRKGEATKGPTISLDKVDSEGLKDEKVLPKIDPGGESYVVGPEVGSELDKKKDLVRGVFLGPGAYRSIAFLSLLKEISKKKN